jgi:vacuolar-type H+-ATPase subunit E/Vma4
MSDEKKPLKIVFEPGCFDSFEGSQEELNELMEAIKKQFESGDFLENSREVDEEYLEELMEEDPEFAEHLVSLLTADTPDRKLH